MIQTATTNPNGVRTGIIVVTVTLLVGIALGVITYRQYTQSIKTMEDLFTAFVYFMEDTDGRFPSSSAEFFQVGMASGFLQELPDGGFQVQPRRDSEFRPHAYSVPIRDLDNLDVAWGADLSKLSYEKPPVGIVRDEKGNDALLIGDITSVKGRRYFTYDLLRVRADMLGVEIPEFVRTNEHPEGRPQYKEDSPATNEESEG